MDIVPNYGSLCSLSNAIIIYCSDGRNNVVYILFFLFRFSKGFGCKSFRTGNPLGIPL
jgi:hypothetical protein